MTLCFHQKIETNQKWSKPGAWCIATSELHKQIKAPPDLYFLLMLWSTLKCFCTTTAKFLRQKFMRSFLSVLRIYKSFFCARTHLSSGTRDQANREGHFSFSVYDIRIQTSHVIRTGQKCRSKYFANCFFLRDIEICPKTFELGYLGGNYGILKKKKLFLVLKKKKFSFPWKLFFSLS